MFTSSELHEGEVYTRDILQQMFNITDQTLFTGIFRPAGHDSIWLFVTERKSADMTEYHDVLDGDTLHWDGQTSGRKDALIIGHERMGLELLVFYRHSKQQYPGAGFIYEGRFRYVSHTGAAPTHFVLQRMRAKGDETISPSSNHYSMRIQWSETDNAFVVTVPELPGCMTHGANYEDAVRQGQDAIESWIEANRAWGRPIPMPQTIANA